jgi:hypothetical protein
LLHKQKRQNKIHIFVCRHWKKRGLVVMT